LSHLANNSSNASATLRIVADRAEGERIVADEIEALLARKPEATLGLATGGTMTGLYGELSRRHAAGRLSFARAKGFNLDEYLGLAPDDARSFAAYMRRSLFDRVDFAPGAARLPRGDAADPAAESEAWEAAIAAAGGIDLQLLGIGRNGHIGFNEPGSARDSRTRVVELDATTRGDAVAGFGSLDLVPRQAITAGVATILASRRIVLLAFGRSKAAIVRRMLRGPVGPECPASWLQAVGHALVVLDHEAAAEL
jgi:glucosamine-6-phosphate deaminase